MVDQRSIIINFDQAMVPKSIMLHLLNGTEKRIMRAPKFYVAVLS